MNVKLLQKNDKLELEKKEAEEKIEVTERYYKRVIAEIKDKKEIRDFTRSKKYSNKAKSYENIDPNIVSEYQAQTMHKKMAFSQPSSFSRTKDKQTEESEHQQTIFDRAVALHQKLSKLTLDEACVKCNSMIEQLKESNEI